MITYRLQSKTALLAFVVYL